MPLAPVAAAWLTLATGSAQAQSGDTGALQLEPSPAIAPPPRGAAVKPLPIVLRARSIRGQGGLETVAEGDAEFRRGGTVISADRLGYDQVEDLATAQGSVRATKDGNVYTGDELQLRVERFEGFFLHPTYFFGRVQAGGAADRIDFLDDQRAVATGATYSSCTPDNSGERAWVLKTDRIRLDFDANEGVAEGAVLRFQGVPILAGPSISFPLTDERKSGWLPPDIKFDSKSGLQVSAPYYWNIAPNRDMTITPGLITKRGVLIGTEARYLEPNYGGVAELDLLAHDAVAGRSRYALQWSHDALLAGDTGLSFRSSRVSDADYWRDFPHALASLTPRLLPTDLQVARPWGQWDTYARAMRWQVLQNPEALIETPYERLPQVGARTLGRWVGGFEYGAEVELNHFTNPVDTVNRLRVTGTRAHTLASLSRPWVTPGWSLVPKLTVNAASYSLDRAMTDGRTSASRVIPTFSLDSAWVLERDTSWFGHALRQTLEPRLLYVNTPFHDQSRLPNFDSAAKDFNADSIYTENSFSGIDRVSDAHQLTAGVTTRVLDPNTGAENARLGIVQRYLFRDQRVTPDGTTFSQRFSDVLLLGSTSLVPRWWLDASLQYSPDLNRTTRSVLTARWSPGEFRTISATYRLSRDLTEQLELGWQWPLYRREGATESRAGTGSCSGTWYGVGRVNYSMRDSRINDSVVGFEYDAGCWIGRVVTERLSTGQSTATTRVWLQLELVGLSRLGTNPLQVLKDNIPGYRLLREGSPAASPRFYD